jgi:hypothetical protein
VIEWVKRAEGISFTHAVELLKRNHLPSASSTIEPPPKISTVPKLPPLFQANVDDQKLLGIVVDRYHATLKQTPGAPVPHPARPEICGDGGALQAGLFQSLAQHYPAGQEPRRGFAPARTPGGAGYLPGEKRA